MKFLELITQICSVERILNNIHIARPYLGPHGRCFIPLDVKHLPFTIQSIRIKGCSSRLTFGERAREFLRRIPHTLKRPWQMNMWLFLWPPKEEDRRTIRIAVDGEYVTEELPAAAFDVQAFPVRLKLPTAHRTLSITLENHSSQPVSFEAVLEGEGEDMGSIEPESENENGSYKPVGYSDGLSE